MGDMRESLAEDNNSVDGRSEKKDKDDKIERR